MAKRKTWTGFMCRKDRRGSCPTAGPCCESGPGCFDCRGEMRVRIVEIPGGWKPKKGAKP